MVLGESEAGHHRCALGWLSQAGRSRGEGRRCRRMCGADLGKHPNRRLPSTHNSHPQQPQTSPTHPPTHL